MADYEFLNNKDDNTVLKKIITIVGTQSLRRILFASAFFEFNKEIEAFLKVCVSQKIRVWLMVGNDPYHMSKDSAQRLDLFRLKNKYIFIHAYKNSKQNPHFHSKFYVFDNSSAIFGSSNMTNAGFKSTYESNFYTENRGIIRNLSKEFFKIPRQKFKPEIYNASKIGGRSPELAPDTQQNLPDMATPFSYQQEIISTILQKFETHDKGHVILPCGTGKTLISLWVNEEMNNNKVLVFLPTLALLKQTLEQWNLQKHESYEVMCVCSDKTVGLSLDETKTTTDELVNLKIVTKENITTDPKVIKKFISKTTVNGKKFVIFSTYHSSGQILEAYDRSVPFDCIFYDESHNIATVKTKEAKKHLIQSHYINSNKKLFMTATPKIINPGLLVGLKKEDFSIYSMDDEKTFGPEFYNMTFREAIENDEIPVLPYKILLAVLPSRIGVAEDRKQIALMNVLAEQTKPKPRFNVNKIISYHSDVKNAKQFIAGNFEKIRAKYLKKDLFYGHINGYDSAAKRKKTLDKLKDSKKGIITNCRCLSEGINSPSIDAVFFSDPKTNVIDIIQATGRAMRKDPNNPAKQTSYVIIPISDESTLINVANILQGLALTDKNAEQLISSIISAHGANHPPPPKPGWIDFVSELSDKKIEILWEKLSINIAQNNIKLGSQGRTLPSGQGGNGFFKRLTHNDVRGLSSPGNFSIDRDYVKYFPRALTPIQAGTGFDVFFDIIFVNENGTEEKVRGVRHMYYDAKKHKRFSSEDHRFTFRNQKFYQRRGMEEGDILKFEPNTRRKQKRHFPMKITLIKKDSDAAKKSPFRDARRAGEL